MPFTGKRSLAVIVVAAASLLCVTATYAETDDPPEKSPQARSLADLLDWVRLGEEVYVTATSGKEVKGTIAGITEGNGALLLRGNDGKLTRIPEGWLDTIELKYDDPVGNGAVGGLVAGLAFAAILSFACDDEYGACFMMSGLFFGAAGAGIGAGADALSSARRQVYRAPRGRNTLQISAAPTISPKRKSLAFVLTW